MPVNVRQAVYKARQRPWRVELGRWCQDLVPDRLIHGRQFQQAFGHPIQWANPTTFMEKIHWLMRYDRRPVLTQCADKVAVRDYVCKRVGPDVLTRLYGVWTDPDKIDFTALPLPCVLKVNHGSGQMLFIPSPPTLFRIEKIRAQLAVWLRRSEYWVSREWAYKDIPPRILCEEFLSDASGASPTDYKFHCFGGVPLMIQVDLDRFTNHERLMRSPEWAPLPFDMTYPQSRTMPPPPPTLGAMLDAARCLSREHPYVRVDLYTLDLRIVFGEMTWYPNGGMEQIIPASWDTTIGGWLTLPTLAFCCGKSSPLWSALGWQVLYAASSGSGAAVGVSKGKPSASGGSASTLGLCDSAKSSTVQGRNGGRSSCTPMACTSLVLSNVNDNPRRE